MKRKALVIGAVVIIVAAAAAYLLNQEGMSENNEAERGAVQDVVLGFGQALKNVSLLSPTAAQDIAEQYRDFLTPELIARWQADPSQALGRVSSSPWPDRIEVSSVERNDASYRVEGIIIEVTSVEQVHGGAAAKRPIALALENFGDRWLIADVSAESYEGAQGDSLGWKTVRDPSSGISFRYPENFPATYIYGHTWPPTVEARIAQFLCAEPLRRVNNREYCIGQESDGAAGSVYTAYTYNTMKDDRMVTVRFTLRYSQCGKYDDPQKTACDDERSKFDLDSLVYKIVQTAQL